MPKGKSILVIGGGTAGLTVAEHLAGSGLNVTLIEASPFLGGHAARFSCKATDRCVKCNACMISERLTAVIEKSTVDIHRGCRIKSVDIGSRYTITLYDTARYIDAALCTRCGRCLAVCPVADAIDPGWSAFDTPVIHQQNCLYFQDKNCSLCRQDCPEKAIHFAAEGVESVGIYDAVVLASGFTVFDPSDKPYGYQQFSNVITHLELDAIFRRRNLLERPSDGRTPSEVAFIQCVGSRDLALGHLWCSTVCCASSLRLAKLIKWKHPRTKVTCFYQDIQTFGKNFQTFYDGLQKDVRLVRSIPGNIFQTQDDRLKINFFDPDQLAGVEECYDLVVLTVGMLPGPETKRIAGMLGIKAPDWCSPDPLPDSAKGIFMAGSALAPMNIPETIDHAVAAAQKVARYLETR